MSKTYEMIMDSLTEIVTDLETSNGKNLKRETVAVEVSKPTDEKLKHFKPARLRSKNPSKAAS